MNVRVLLLQVSAPQSWDIFGLLRISRDFDKLMRAKTLRFGSE